MSGAAFWGGDVRRLVTFTAILAITVTGSAIWAAGENEVWGVNLVSGVSPHREIPTNRWFWVEIFPGIFARQLEEPAEAAIEAAAAAPQFAQIEANLPEVSAQMMPSLWCLEYMLADDRYRLACVEATR